MNKKQKKCLSASRSRQSCSSRLHSSPLTGIWRLLAYVAAYLVIAASASSPTGGPGIIHGRAF